MEEKGEEEGVAGGFHRTAKRLRTEKEADVSELEEGEEEEEAEASADEEDEGRNVERSRSRRIGGKDSVEDSHRIPPSPVVHVRGLCDAVVEADLVEALEKFGKICYVMMMPFKRQALVEFDSMESAERCVTCGAREAIYIADQQAFFNFSTSQRITRPTNADDPSSRNKVLLLSIQNPLYPITTDVLYTVCNPVGNVLRIVIFKRNGIQAMVEYPSVEDAQKAKLALNGADIYSGCCTLKIEYARPNRLNVVRNDNTSWDYTKPFLLHRDRGKGRQRQAILGEHPSNGYGPHCPLLPLPANSRYRRSHEQAQEMISYPPLLPKTFSSSTSSSSMLGSSSVAMVSGLNPTKTNCSHIFNLFCLYGNVEKVKFMKSVPGTALVEMGDEYAVDRAVTHLNSIKVFGKKLNVCVSKQQAVIPSQMFELADGSSSYQDFSLTRNNRFNSTHSSRNIIQPPAAVLHFYNAPPTLSQHQLLKLCSEHDVPTFTKFKVFDAKTSSKTLSGLLEFSSKTEAVEALTVLNHHQIRIPSSSSPFTLKLCFSTSSHL
ncbi:heterogeneous nuclear ribonucleoprotein L like [Nothobranchius furzeri]|uniref:Heterogeneous nuclear ribonucleoprotein L like n=1 Tax=Nothobranchius furzeri TaxID=105023 RepID=A0A9D2Y4V5_NOTFU|nr:heterogeneous nuclear ribonucleoprotein L-like [Nothobranchius furzeri]KAF7213318.1 heterogeneous nuclear ribonucleoprotein L like [Nothobranchius furzeri]